MAAPQAVDHVEAAGRAVQVAGEDEVGRGRRDRRLGLGKGVGPLGRLGAVAQDQFGQPMAGQRERIGQPPLRHAGPALCTGPGERDDGQAVRPRRDCPNPVQQHRAADGPAGVLRDGRPRRGGVEPAFGIERDFRFEAVRRPEHTAA